MYCLYAKYFCFELYEAAMKLGAQKKIKEVTQHYKLDT